MSFFKRCLWVMLCLLIGLACGYLAVFLGLGAGRLLSRPNMEFALRAGALSGVLLSSLILFITMHREWRRPKVLLWLICLWMGAFTALLYALAAGDAAA